ncbi:lipoprotein [Streptomyces yokosukanensis]|uniref:lipoprotein n=1 Tax=Streptomyces yokosukanensis TaxID=67386 RepID=UPI003F4D0117
MQVRVGSVRGRAVVAVALAAVLGGCVGSADGDEEKATGSAATAGGKGAGRTATPTVRGGSIGAAGSGCELPVRFDIAEHWKAEAIDSGAESSKASKGSDGDLSGALAEALLRQGPVTAACEIDARPAGRVGFLRVWTGKPGNADAGGVLRQFVAAQDGVGKERYHSVTTGGGLRGVEVEYLCTSELLGESKQETAFAVSTPGGPVVVHLGGMDTEEHDAMRPAYELAKRTLQLRQ